jgi:hypothetical protein
MKKKKQIPKVDEEPQGRNKHCADTHQTAIIQGYHQAVAQRSTAASANSQ